MLKITSLNVVFGTGAARNHAVKNVSFEIEKGKSFGLIGESGSGKSTVLNCITGLLGLLDRGDPDRRRAAADQKGSVFLQKCPDGFSGSVWIASSQTYY